MDLFMLSEMLNELPDLVSRMNLIQHNTTDFSGYDVAVMLPNKVDARKEALNLYAEFRRHGTRTDYTTTSSISSSYSFPQWVKVASYRDRTRFIKFGFFSVATLRRISEEQRRRYGSAEYFVVRDDDFDKTLANANRHNNVRIRAWDEHVGIGIGDFACNVYKKCSSQNQSSINEMYAELSEFINSFAR